MIELNFSANLLTNLKKILLLIEQRNEQSKTIESEKIKELINDVKDYLDTASNLNLTIPEKKLKKTDLINQMIDLYQYIGDQNTLIDQVSNLLLQYINTLQPKIFINNTFFRLELAHQIDIEYCTGNILEVTPHYIVLDTKTSLTLLDRKNFSLVKTIKLNFYFDSYYKHFSQDKIIFYYRETVHFLLFVDLHTNEQKLISLNHLDGDSLSLIYVWYNDDCIIATYDQHYLKIDIDQAMVQRILLLPTDVLSYFNTIFALRNQHSFKKIDSINNYIVVEDVVSKTYKIIFTKDNICIKMPITIKESHGLINQYHDFHFKNGVLIAVSEEEIQISNSEQILAILKPDIPFDFYRALFLDEQMTQLAIWIHSGISPDYSNLMIYNINWDEIA